MTTTVVTTAPGRSLIVLLGALTAFASLSTDMYLPSLPRIGQEFNVGTATTQATMAVFLIGLAAGQFIYGPLSDRIGRRPPILFGLIAYLLATLICALAPSMPVMLLGRLLQALGCSAGVVLAGAIVRDLYDSTQTARVMNGLVMVMGLAPILAPAVGAGILLLAGWRAIFWVLFVFTALALIRSFVALPESRSAETAAQAAQEHPLRSFLLLLRHRRLVGYLIVNAAASGMLFAYIAGSPALLIQVYGFSPQAYSGLLAVNGIAIIAGAVISSTLVAKLGIDGILARSAVLAVVFLLAMFAFAITGIGGYWSILVTLFLTLSNFGVISSNAIAGALSTDPLRAGSISAMMNGSPFVSAGVTAWLSGVLWDHTARPMAGVMLGCMVIAIVALWSLVLRDKAGTVQAAL